MEDWQERLINEREDLEKRLSGLAQFLNKQQGGSGCLNEYPVSRYSNYNDLLNRQYEIMLQYHQILTQRICLFKGK